MLAKSYRKIIALLFLNIFVVQLFAPMVSYALTSGPSQPEMAKFQPAGATNLVDLFTGDLNYNIPMMDVGGYPINLSYQSGTGIDEEASWVGTGWTLNPGSVNRTLRGLPDDFDGSGDSGDRIVKEYSKKEFRKVGGKIIVKPSLFGWEKGLGGSLSLNVYKDNYYGIGASVGASLGLSVAANTRTPFTVGLGLGINSDTRSGVDITPSLSLDAKRDFSADVYGSAGLSGNLGYNTRSGLKNLSLEASFSTTSQYKQSNIDFSSSSYGSSAVRYFGQTYTPAIGHSTYNEQYTFNFDLGPTLFGGYLGLGGTGYTYKENIAEKNLSIPAYGYMNYLKGRKNSNALLDMNREKDGVFLRSAPSIPTPIATQDYFTATGQTGSQQFRPYFAGNYIVYDKLQSNANVLSNFGVTIGGANLYKFGGRVENTRGGAETSKWVANNNYIVPQEGAYDGGSVSDQPIYFKQVGEHTEVDNTFMDKVGDLTEKVSIYRNGTNLSYKNRSGTRAAPVIKRDSREKKNFVFSYLSAEQSQKYALDKTINSEQRITPNRKSHHISEVTVTDNEGKRMIYGTPVYNIYQEEVSFAVGHPVAQTLDVSRLNGLISYDPSDASMENNEGRDRFYNKEKTSAYASSFLLTGILSPDYVDVTGDGISDDDLGTAVKFKYVKVTDDNNLYKWRAPYGYRVANYNEGFRSSSLDDRANYIYGEKEIWYLQSIESKTMIALFDLSNREDGLGVTGNQGGKNNLLKLKKLDKIKLYSKADYYKNGQSAVPIKTVNLEYDYSICPNVPNNSEEPVLVPDELNPNQTRDLNQNKGKLTLKRIYFTFGTSTRGKSNPYDFEYDMRPVDASSIENLHQIDGGDAEATDDYGNHQTDRWGTYKKSFYNRVVNGSERGLTNSEFPYTIQKTTDAIYNERKLNDLYASKWQLIKIITPTNSVISAEYESDDYAYVQNRRAMQMCFVLGINTEGNSAGLIDKDSKLIVKLPKAVGNINEFKDVYLKNSDGSYQDKLFYKIYADIDNKGHYEFVNGYAEINMTASTASGTIAFIALKSNKDANPVAASAWQMLRTDLPEFAYDSYDNLQVGDGQAAIRSIIAALGNLKEIRTPFEEKARNRKFADKIGLSKSMVRLNNPDKTKMGGGSRVRMIQVSDQWQEMSNVGDSKTAKYGQLYAYTIKDKNGDVESSSGVAAYEPQLGNEENPFHEPVPFTEKVHWGSDKYHYIEKPYCESYFPAATVGYSKVSVTSIGNDYTTGQVLEKHTGLIENEFYTARDFPTIVDNLSLDQSYYENSLILKLFSSTSVNRVTTSQGFRIELNDMHGKLKSVKIYNKGEDMISSSEYFYSVRDENAELKQLDNAVEILRPNGDIINTSIAHDIEMITDVRESKNESIGTSIGAYTGGMIVPAIFVPIFIPYVAVNFNRSISRDTYNSISTLKVVHKYGVLTKTRTVQNGSAIEAENLLWDGQTGEVLLTRTQNEFDDYIYAYNYPAYMVSEYDGMGAAYRNAGLVFNNMTIGTSGDVSSYADYLSPGDELGSLDADIRAWVIKSSGNTLRLIDSDGDFVAGGGTYLMLRSGRRNQLSAGSGTVISMKDPRVNGRLNLDGATQKILDSKVVAYKEEWAMPQYCNVCPPEYSLSADGTKCYKDVPSIYTPPDYTVCEGDTIAEYTSCGSYIYSNYDVNGTTYNRSRIDISNSFWIGFPTHQSSQCAYTPLLSSGLNKVNDVMKYSNADSSKTFKNDLLARATSVRGPLNRTGIWMCPPYDTIVGRWFGFAQTVAVPESKTYYIGMAADNFFRFKVDGVVIREELSNNQENFKLWHIYPVFLDQGEHIIEMDGMNTGHYATLGAEIYNNTAGEISSATGYNQLNLIFSTKDLTGTQFQLGTYSCPISPITYSLNTATDPYSCRSSMPLVQVINPYYKGILGNWRPYVNYVFTVNREQSATSVNQAGGSNVRQSGYYNAYSPFWLWQNGSLARTVVDDQSYPVSVPESRWVYSNKSVYYDQKGNEVESVDALKRYNAVLYGYQQSLVTAVGTNARRNEIMYDGFEDYDFDLNATTQDNCSFKRHFDFGLTKQGSTWTSDAGTLISTISHSGRYSYRLSSETTLRRKGGYANPPSSSVLNYDQTGRYILASNEQATGFAPIPGKKYLISLWVNDHNQTSNKVQNLQISINGQDLNTANTIVPVVEEWKNIQFTFIATHDFELKITPSGSSIEIDDIRILPFNAQMNTHVYDAKSLRLMAQLDENNFATFYEYDDEGTPVRIKKETEKGIMTLKENRQMLRDRSTQ